MISSFLPAAVAVCIAGALVLDVTIALACFLPNLSRADPTCGRPDPDDL